MSSTHHQPDPDREPAWTPDAQFAHPEQMQLPKPPRKRRHIFRWVFLAVQALFLIWVITGASSGSGTPKACAGLTGPNLQTCIDAGHAGTGIGVILIIGLWVAVDVILALTYLIFRKRG